MKPRNTRFTVAARYNGSPFPLDMLRYDSCYPASQEDVGRIDEAMARSLPLGTPITLYHRGLPGATAFSPTTARWESFGWTVVRWERCS